MSAGRRCSPVGSFTHGRLKGRNNRPSSAMLPIGGSPARAGGGSRALAELVASSPPWRGCFAACGPDAGRRVARLCSSQDGASGTATGAGGASTHVAFLQVRLAQHRTDGGAHGARGSELSQMSGVPSGCCAFADAGVGTTMIRARKSSALGNSAADRSVARDADPRQSMTGEPGDLTGRVGFARQEGLISDYPVAVLSSWRMASSASITSSRSTLDLVNRS
jgi:hypothetical protein